MPKLTLDCRGVAQATLDRIVTERDKYDQTTWQTVLVGDVDFSTSSRVYVGCQTTGCVAGTASMLAGDKAVVLIGTETENRGGRLVYSISEVITPDGEINAVSERGRELLCLNSHQTCWLFSGDRTLAEVINALMELAAGKPLSYTYEHQMSADKRDRLLAYRPRRKARPRVQHVPAPEVTPVQQHHHDPA